MRLDDDLKYFEDPEFKKLLAQYESAREEGMPLYMDAEDLTDIAEYYAMVAEDEVSSNEVIDFALQLHPDAVDPQIFRARQMMIKGDNDLAQQYCDAIPDQQHREVYFLRAELLVREEKTEDAFRMLFSLMDTINEDRDFFIYDSAYIFIDYHHFDWALCFANRLEEMAPQWYKTWQLQADVQLGIENNRNALTYIEKMLDIDPFYVETWNWRAEAYSNLGEYNKAIESLEYALAIEQDNERALQLKAWVFMQQNNCREAHEIYERLERTNPENEQHWLYDSYCMLDMDDTEKSLQKIEKAVELAGGVSADQRAIHEQYAQVLSRIGRVDDALKQLDKAEKLWEEQDKWDDRLLRMRVYAENNEPELAAKEMVAQIKEDIQESYQPFYEGALVYFDYGYYDEAAKLLTVIAKEINLSATPLPHGIFCYMAYAYMELGDNELALKNLRKAIDAQEPHLSELFAEKFPDVPANELYDYYYYKVYNRWPEK